MSIAWNPGPGSTVPLALLDSLLQLQNFRDVEGVENQTFDHLLSAPQTQKIANKL